MFGGRVVVFGALFLLACGSFLLKSVAFPNPILCRNRWFALQLQMLDGLEFFMPTPAPKVSLRARKTTVVAISVVLLSLAVIASVVVYEQQQPAVQKINYSQLYTLGGATGATALIVEGETLTVRKQDGSLVEAIVTGEAAQHEIVELFRKNNVPVEFRALQPGLVVSVLNWALPFLCLAFLAVAGW